MNDSFIEKIDGLVKEGKISQEEADKLKSVLKDEDQTGNDDSLMDKLQDLLQKGGQFTKEQVDKIKSMFNEKSNSIAQSKDVEDTKEKLGNSADSIMEKLQNLLHEGGAITKEKFEEFKNSLKPADDKNQMADEQKKMDDDLKKKIDALSQDGKLTAEEANKIKASLGKNEPKSGDSFMEKFKNLLREGGKITKEEFDKIKASFNKETQKSSDDSLMEKIEGMLREGKEVTKDEFDKIKSSLNKDDQKSSEDSLMDKLRNLFRDGYDRLKTMVNGDTQKSNESFLERIESLLQDKKISQEEADKLRSALNNEKDKVENVTDEWQSSTKEQPDMSRQTDTNARSQGIPLKEQTLKKVVVTSPAGDVHIKGVKDLKEVKVLGPHKDHLETRHEGDTFWVSSHGRAEKERHWFNFLMRTIGRFTPIEIKLEVPAELEILEIKSMAGDVDIENITGRAECELKAGDISLSDISSFVIKAMAGDVDVRTQLNNGKSEITATAGNIDIKLLPGSDVSVSAAVTAGDIKLQGLKITKEERSVASEQAEGIMGNGTARLELRLNAGNIKVEGSEQTTDQREKMTQTAQKQ